MTTKCEVLYASDDQHEKVFAEILVDDQIVLIISVESAETGPAFEFYTAGNKSPTTVRCSVILSAIEEAISGLIGKKPGS